jgi:hypothetical protein
VHFYATTTDQEHLLDHLGEPHEATLQPWPVVTSPPIVLSREVALIRGQVMILSRALGPPTVLRKGDSAMAGPSRAAAFNRLNWEQLEPQPAHGLVDSNASPVLLWTPATLGPDGLRSGNIGSQADSMSAVSTDYERWAKHTMNWVRRKGTRVWGWQLRHQRSGLDLHRTDVTTVYALPDALKTLQAGTPGR